MDGPLKVGEGYAFVLWGSYTHDARLELRIGQEALWWIPGLALKFHKFTLLVEDEPVLVER